MTIQEHTNTSMAVKAVITEIKRQLARRFDFLEGMPDLFYDIDRGLSDQFKQYYAKIPISKRQNPWISLAYSYDSQDSSAVHPRKGLYWWRPVDEFIRRKINVAYVQLPLLISILCNDSKTFNALSNFILNNFDWSFTAKYPDLLWPEWTPNYEIPLGWYIRPTQYNGKLYMCSKSGKTSETEPKWDIESEFTVDGTCEWKTIEPDMLKVRTGDFVHNDAIISNPIQDGIMYQQDFGYTLYYTNYDDSGELDGVVKEATLNLLEMYNPEYVIDKTYVNIDFLL